MCGKRGCVRIYGFGRILSENCGEFANHKSRNYRSFFRRLSVTIKKVFLQDLRELVPVIFVEKRTVH